MATELSRAYGLALNYLGRRARSVWEMTRYLAGKNISEETIDTVLERLMNDGYLDDEAFARQFVDSRIRRKPKSTYALGYELRQKGISAAVSAALLRQYDDEALAFSAAALKQGQWRHLDQEARRTKLLNHLRYRGFDHNTCLAAWEHFKTLEISS